jgi:two-component system, sensor histidine kinase PdtaS
LADPIAPRLSGRLGFRLGLVLSLALLPVGVVALIQSDKAVRSANANVEAALMGETRRAVSPESALIQQLRGTAATLASLAPAILAEPDQCDSFAQAITSDGLHRGFSYFDSSGAVVCLRAGDRDGPLGMVPTQQMFETPTIRATDPGTPGSMLLASHPIRNLDGTRAGVVTVMFANAEFLQSASDFSGAGDLALAILTTDGQVISANQDMNALNRLLPEGVTLAGLAATPALTYGAARETGEQRAFSVIELGGRDLVAFGSWPADGNGIIASPLAVTLPTALMWLVSLIVAVLAAEVLVTRHIRDLRTAIMQFADGQRTIRPLDLSRAPDEIRDTAAAFVSMTDIILHDEAELENSVHQKEVLLREMHHRVKNNLQLIASIISLQMREMASGEARTLLKAVQDRVISLATVHKDLYLTSDLTEVRADELLPDILRQLMTLSSQPDRDVDLRTDLQPVALTADQAVPLALLVAEALTHTRQEADAGASGTPWIGISLRQTSKDHAALEISHSVVASALVEPGAGLKTGLGGQLISAFAGQLEGVLDFSERKDSHHLRLEFPLVMAQPPKV